jgi:hypothetical protein
MTSGRLMKTTITPSGVEGASPTSGRGFARRSPRAALVLGALLLSACPVPPGPGDSGPGDGGDALWPDGTLVLGAPVSDSDLTFQLLPAEVDLHPGAQGGYHVPLMYRVDGQTEPGATFDHRVTRVRDGVLVSKGSRVYDVSPDGTGSWSTGSAVVIFLCPTPVGVNVIDEALSFEVTMLRSPDVVLTRATAQAVVHCPAGASSCQLICKG